MQNYPQTGMEFLELLPSNQIISFWIDYNVWLMLQFKFMLPAYLINANDEISNFVSQVSLNGIKATTICRP
jgi:hypothetical protein